MKRSLWIATLLVLGAIIYLSFVRPHQMVSPGDLIPAHSALQNDCFACHAPLQGASVERCTTCHTIADIGLRTSKGVAIPISSARPAFHQSLAKTDCMACHSDHPRPRLTKTTSVRFEHTMLKAGVRSNCQSCHKPPRDELHIGQDLGCAACHQTAHWKPATFAHDRLFVLDGHHDAACKTCHLGGNYQRYTCYGCHEHQEAQIIAEHRREGIANIENCVRCHRSAEGGGEGEDRDD